MEDAIVAQVEWYMGRVNLLGDSYLKAQMDADLWVDLQVILAFPKMMKMGVTDVGLVASLLAQRSSIVEVDDSAKKIRPAWARRSTLVVSDVAGSVRVEDLLALMAQDSAQDDAVVSHVQGLLSMHPAAEGVWVAIFDSPNGAGNVLPLVADKVMNGQKLRAEVHVENLFAAQQQVGAYPRSPSVQGQQQQQQQVYAGGPRQGQDATAASGYAPMSHMMNPMGMPVPVMHPAAHDGMHQYGYAPYVPHAYVPQMTMHRQYIAPRGLQAHPNYVVGYGASGHPAMDPGMGVAPQGHAVQGASQQQMAQQQQTESSPLTGTVVQNSVTENGQSAVAATPTSQSQGGAAASNESPGGSTAAVLPDGVQSAEESYVADKGLPAHVVAQEGQRYVQTGHISVSGQMQMPIMGAQAMDPSQMMAVPMREHDPMGRGGGGKTGMDSHYMHRGNIVGDPNVIGLASGPIGGGYSRSAGRGQNQGNIHRGDRGGQRHAGDGRGPQRGTGAGGMDGGGRGSANRKGKKGGRNNGRHAHGHSDRSGEGRGYDGKGDGTGSPSNRDDRRGSRDDKPKQEPNFNAMHFPPLPVSSDSSTRGRPQAVAKDEKDKVSDVPETKMATGDETTSASPSLSSVDVVSPRMGDTVDITPGSEGIDSSIAAAGKAEGTESLDKASTVTTQEKDASVLSSDSASNSDGPDPKPVAKTSAPEKKPGERPGSSGSPNGATLSYAAILRSKKPVPPPRPASALQRGSSDSSSNKSGDTNSGADASSQPTSAPNKDRNPRRRKSNNNRGGNNADNKDSDSSSGVVGTSNKDGSKGPAVNLANGAKDTSPREAEGKGKVHPEATRAHSVWANKPKSLFQAAATVPAGRPKGPVPAVTPTKAVAAASDGEKTKDKSPADDQPKAVSSNGQTDSALSDAQAGLISDSASNGSDVSDVNQGALDKATQGGSVTEAETIKHGIMEQPKLNGQGTPKGAWALGGPKGWPKGDANGLVERSSSISES